MVLWHGPIPFCYSLMFKKFLFVPNLAYPLLGGNFHWDNPKRPWTFCPLMRGVHYSGCPLVRGFTVITLKHFLGRLNYVSWKNIWEWKILELVLLNCCNCVFSNSQGFNNIQFKSSTRKKLSQLAISKFDSANVLLNCSLRFN